MPRRAALVSLVRLVSHSAITAARFPSRLDEQGDLQRLHDQDRSRWDQPLITAGLTHLALAAEGSDLSEYHLQAGIAACHCLAADAASTDWARIISLYDQLQRLQPSPVVALNRAVAVAHLHGPQAGLDALATMPRRDRLEDHHLLHAVEGELHWRLHHHEAAAQSFRRALQLSPTAPEQHHLSRLLERSAETLV